MSNPMGNTRGSNSRRPASANDAARENDGDEEMVLNSSMGSSHNRSVYMGVSADSVHSPRGPQMGATPMFLGSTHRFLAGSVPFAGSAPDPSVLALSPPDDGTSRGGDAIAAFLAAQNSATADSPGTDGDIKGAGGSAGSSLGMLPPSVKPLDASATPPRVEEVSTTSSSDAAPMPAISMQAPPGSKGRTTILVPSAVPTKKQATTSEAAPAPGGAAAEPTPRSAAASTAEAPPPSAASAPSASKPKPAAATTTSSSRAPAKVPTTADASFVAPTHRPPPPSKFDRPAPQEAPPPPPVAAAAPPAYVPVVTHHRRTKSDEVVPSAATFRVGNASPSPVHHLHAHGVGAGESSSAVRGLSPARRLVTAGSTTNRGSRGGSTNMQLLADTGGDANRRSPGTIAANTTFHSDPTRNTATLGGTTAGGTNGWRSSSAMGQAVQATGASRTQLQPMGMEARPKSALEQLMTHNNGVSSAAPSTRNPPASTVMPPYQEYLRRQGLRRQDGDGSRGYAFDTNSIGRGGTMNFPSYGASMAGDLAIPPALQGERELGRKASRGKDELRDITDPLAWRSVSPGAGGARPGSLTPSKSSGDNQQSPKKHSRVLSGNLIGSIFGSGTPGGGGATGAGGAGGNGGGQPPRRRGAFDDRKVAAAVDEDEMLEKQRRNAATTSALHSIPWLQRQVETSTGYGGDQCAMCVAPRFWVRVDWTLRATLLAVLPATIISLEPSTTGYFALPSTVASFAYWISAPTLGAGLREFAIVLKGSAITILFLVVVIAINPVNQGLFVFLYFLQILMIALVAESVKKTGAWCIAVFMLQLYSDPELTGYTFARDFFVSVIIGGLIGLGAFLFPRINWAHKLAAGSCTTYGSAISIIIQGVVSSYWSKTEMEREFCLIRIRQLINITVQCQTTLETRLSEAQYEPHSAETLDRIQRRSTFLDEMARIVACMLQLVQNIAAKPEIGQSPLLKPFGERLAEPLGVLVSAMDNTVLKICDMKHPVTLGDIMLFQRVREDFQDHVSRIREELILNNDDYYTDEPDIFLGAFLFCIDELGETIESFREPAPGKSRLLEWAMSPIEDIKSGYNTVRFFLKMLLTKGTLIRRAKEAIKLALSMTIPVLIQVFMLEPEDATPVAGPALIAFVYQRTGAESFQYASNRVLGTVIGSLTALISVQVADGKLWLMYIFLGILSLVGNFIMTSTSYTAAGNALVFSVISIISQYSDADAAMGRIQQNVFAILIYFIIAYTVWPVRASEKLTLELDSAIRSYRETIYKLLGNMDSSMEDVQEAILGAEEHWKEYSKRILRQGSLIPAALREPTLIGAAFPEPPWLRLIQSQQTLAHLAWMMRYAFSTFENNQSDASGDRSLHWVVVKHIAPEARECAELIFAACDLYLLALSHSEMVPIQHLVRLRISMVTIYRQMIKTYCAALVVRLDDDKLTNNSAGEPSQASQQPTGGKGMVEQEAKLRTPARALQQGNNAAKKSSGAQPPRVPPPPEVTREPPAFPNTPDLNMSITAAADPAVASSSQEHSSSGSQAFTKTRRMEDGRQKTMKDLPHPSPRISPGQVAVADSPPLPPMSSSLPPPVALPAGVESPVLSGTIADEVGIDFSQTMGEIHNNSNMAAKLGISNPSLAVADPDAAPSEASFTNYVLRNRDIHSLEAFLFGIRASVMEIDEFQKALLEVQHAADLVKKL